MQKQDFNRLFLWCLIALVTLKLTYAQFVCDVFKKNVI